MLVEHFAHLEKMDVFAPVSSCCFCQSGQQRRSQNTVLGRGRVSRRHALARLVQRVEIAKRVGDDLVKTGSEQSLPQFVFEQFPTVRTAERSAASRKCFRNKFVAMNSTEFFD